MPFAVRCAASLLPPRNGCPERALELCPSRLFGRPQRRAAALERPLAHRGQPAASLPCLVPQAMFKAWEKKMRKAVLARKLPSDWLPQLHPQTGEAFYFNLATGESRREHPSVRQADLIAARERRSGHEQMDARFALIGEYKHGVVEAAEAVRAGCAARVVAMCAQHAEEWLRTRKGATEDSDLAGAAVSRSPAT